MRRSTLFICLVILAPLSRAMPSDTRGGSWLGLVSLHSMDSDGVTVRNHKDAFLPAPHSAHSASDESRWPDHPYIDAMSSGQPRVTLDANQVKSVDAGARWQGDAGRQPGRISDYAQSFLPRVMRRGGHQLHKDWNVRLRPGGARQVARTLRATPVAGIEARMDYRINPLQTLSLRADFGMTMVSGASISGWGRISAVLNLRF